MWGHAFMRVGCQEELGYNDSGFFYDWAYGAQYEVMRGI